MGLIVTHDGTPAWRAVRLGLVAGAALAVWAAVRSRRPGVCAATGLAASLVAVPVGVGIAVPHVLAGSSTVMSAAGVLVLVGGLILFASSIGGLWRVDWPRWRRAPACGALVLVLVTGCWTLGQAVAATNVPRPDLGSRTPAQVGLAYRDVEFRATDGVRLSGWYVPSRNGAAVALVHGAGSTRSDVLGHAVMLARHGYGVLLFDARGHGRSEGRAMDFGWFGDEDVGGAVTFLQTLSDVDDRRIGALGLSMGGEEALGAAAAIPDIRVVIAEGATNRVAGDKAWLSDEFGVRGAVSEIVESFTYRFADLLTSASPPISLHDAVRSAGRPTLLIAAGDVADEARAGRYIRSGSPGTVELWIAPDSGHTEALRAHPAEWEARVIGLLDEAIGSGAVEH